MATISRFRAVANVGSLELRGFLAWIAWLFIHILYLVGFQDKVSTLGHWAVAFIGRSRAERTLHPGAGTLVSDDRRSANDREIVGGRGNPGSSRRAASPTP